ncbi:MAG: ATP-dependent helicase HrpB [Planctomycetes bacterium]|nr:ATP-dependent helicase HrpB [Planctomycetota bacterium]
MSAALPIDDHLHQLGDLLDRSGAVVLVAETGAGKTTRVPPFISRRHPGGRVLVLEPRRIAARAAARRMAEEEGSPLGSRIGFRTRFESEISERSEIEVLTEGLFLRRIQADPELAGVAAVILDEFHERSLDLDLSLAFLTEIRSSLRPDLELVVMSATIDPEPIAAYLGAVGVLRVPGRSHPVAIEHDRVQEDGSLEDRAARALREELAEGEGHVLVFLPGMASIQRVRDRIADLEGRDGLEILRLHGELGAAEQDLVFRPAPGRRAILATNVAETSLTIPGVRVVIDGGRARVLRQDPDLGLDRLELERISRAAADQRAGRAGREAPGRARRLWTLADERAMAAADEPEIRRVDLAGALLEILAWGATDPRSFGWFEAPPEPALEAAIELLDALGALERGPRGLRLGALGRQLARIPASPRIARMLVEGARRGVAERAAWAAALLGERDPLPFEERRRLAGSMQARSDLLLRLDLVAARDRRLDRRALTAIESAARQYRRILRGLDDGRKGDDEDLMRALLVGFPDRVAAARGDGRRALLCGGRGLQLLDESVLRDEPLFLALRLEAGRRGRGSESPVAWASAIERSWLEEMLPEALVVEELARFDEQAEKVRVLRRLRYRDLVLEERALGSGDPRLVAAELERALRARPELLLRRVTTPALERLRDRLALFAERWPESGIVALDDAALIELLAGETPGRSSFAELAALDLVALIRAELGWQKANLVDREAPERLDLPGGRSAALRYEKDRVVLGARVQHLFGLLETPRILGGRVPVVVELLAPNMRPVQVTADLAGFWRSSYQLVRKDLRGRYPKHDWPERPPGV